MGRPNVGKSTLLNRLLGTKLAATTHKPQTTRKNLLGILHPPGGQLLLLDTPGYHQAKGPLNRYMVEQAQKAISDADVIGYLVEARTDGVITPGNERVLEVLQSSRKPVVLLLNKTDRIKDKSGILHQLKAYSDRLKERMRAAVPISAYRGTGLEEAVIELARALPVGPAFFGDDQLTDSTEQAVAAEFVREKVILATQEELPYSAAVTIDRFEDARPRLVRIIATIHVERASQKPIVIGKQGDRIKRIGVAARRDLEFFLSCQVYLELHVRVTTEWSNHPRGLAELGYADDGGGMGSGFAVAEVESSRPVSGGGDDDDGPAVLDIRAALSPQELSALADEGPDELDFSGDKDEEDDEEDG